VPEAHEVRSGGELDPPLAREILRQRDAVVRQERRELPQHLDPAPFVFAGGYDNPDKSPIRIVTIIPRGDLRPKYGQGSRDPSEIA